MAASSYSAASSWLVARWFQRWGCDAEPGGEAAEVTEAPNSEAEAAVGEKTAELPLEL